MVGNVSDDDLLPDEEPPPATTTQLALPGEYPGLAKLLSNPKDLLEGWTPEGEWAKFLPEKTSPDVDKLEADLQDQEALLQLQSKKLAGGSESDTKKKIAALNEKKEKASSSAEEALKLAACELELCRKQQSGAESTRVARTEAAATQAATRSEKLEEICLEQIRAWETHLKQLRSARTAREAEWEARRLLVENRALEVAELPARKIEEAYGQAPRRRTQPWTTSN